MVDLHPSWDLNSDDLSFDSRCPDWKKRQVHMVASLPKYGMRHGVRKRGSRGSGVARIFIQ